MGLITYTTPGSAYWASYLINGDASGMTDQEIALCDAWQKRLAPAYVVDVERDAEGEAGDPYFTWSYDLHTGDDCQGGECINYVMHEQE